MLIRINTTYAPNGSFPLFGAELPDVNDKPTFIGYDAAVCIEAYEPWIVEAYNATGIAPTLTRVVSKGANVPDKDDSRSEGKRNQRLSAEDVNVSRSINSTGKSNPFDSMY